MPVPVHSRQYHPSGPHQPQGCAGSGEQFEQGLTLKSAPPSTEPPTTRRANPTFGHLQQWWRLWDAPSTASERDNLLADPARSAEAGVVQWTCLAVVTRCWRSVWFCGVACMTDDVGIERLVPVVNRDTNTSVGMGWVKLQKSSAAGCRAGAKGEERGNQNSSMIRPSWESTPCSSRSRTFCRTTFGPSGSQHSGRSWKRCRLEQMVKRWK
eukprot:scaffold896_cov250-Pinguiococcus_pyrenoidosus.AAC.3